MKQLLAIAAILFSLPLFSQKKAKQKSIDFEEVNSMMSYAKADTISFLKLEDDAFGKLYSKYQSNSAVKDSLSKLDENMLYFNLYVSDVVKEVKKEDVSLEKLQEIKQRYPLLNMSGYEKVLTYYKAKQLRQKAAIDSISVAKKVKAIKKEQGQQKTEDHTNVPKWWVPSKHGRLSLFIGFDLNEVLPNLQAYMQERLNLQSLDDKTTVENGWFKVAYTPGISAGKQKLLWLMAKTDNKNRVQQIKITGESDSIIQLFCWYWPTSISFEEAKKKEIAVEHLGEERIALTVIGNNSSISISK